MNENKIIKRKSITCFGSLGNPRGNIHVIPECAIHPKIGGTVIIARARVILNRLFDIIDKGKTLTTAESSQSCSWMLGENIFRIGVNSIFFLILERAGCDRRLNFLESFESWLNPSELCVAVLCDLVSSIFRVHIDSFI